MRWYALDLMRSNYCLLVFLISFFLGYYFLPEAVFHQASRWLALVYLLVFAFLLTCLARGVKDKVSQARRRQSSLLGALAAVLGFSAFQFCGLAAPVCGLSLGGGLAAALFPAFVQGLFANHGIMLIYISIVIQTVALYQLGCLRKTN